MQMIEVIDKEIKTVCMWEREGERRLGKCKHDEERKGRYKRDSHQNSNSEKYNVRG